MDPAESAPVCTPTALSCQRALECQQGQLTEATQVQKPRPHSASVAELAVSVLVPFLRSPWAPRDYQGCCPSSAAQHTLACGRWLIKCNEDKTVPRLYWVE